MTREKRADQLRLAKPTSGTKVADAVEDACESLGGARRAVCRLQTGRVGRRGQSRTRVRMLQAGIDVSTEEDLTRIEPLCP